MAGVFGWLPTSDQIFEQLRLLVPANLDMVSQDTDCKRGKQKTGSDRFYSFMKLLVSFFPMDRLTGSMSLFASPECIIVVFF